MNYQAPDNTLHFIDPKFEYLLPKGSIQITEDEAQQLNKKNEIPISEIKKAEIKHKLLAIDADSIRALRAIINSTAKGLQVSEFDAAKIEAIEKQAAALRAELAAL